MVKEETRPWLDKAHEDLSAAEALLSTDHLAPSMVRYPETTLIVSDEQAASFIALAQEVVA